MKKFKKEKSKKHKIRVIYKKGNSMSYSALNLMSKLATAKMTIHIEQFVLDEYNKQENVNKRFEK